MVNFISEVEAFIEWNNPLTCHRVDLFRCHGGDWNNWNLFQAIVEPLARCNIALLVKRVLHYFPCNMCLPSSIELILPREREIMRGSSGTVLTRSTARVPGPDWMALIIRYLPHPRRSFPTVLLPGCSLTDVIYAFHGSDANYVGPPLVCPSRPFLGSSVGLLVILVW